VGYEVRATEINVRIRAEHEAYVLGVLREFNEKCPPEMKRGMSFGYDDDADERRWFSWMRADFAEYESLGQLLDEMGFGHAVNDGWIVLTGWHGDKQGQEDLLMEAIAGWVEPGSYIEWVGEDCARWRWEFSPQRELRVRQATTGWSPASSTPTELRLAAIGVAARLESLRAESTSGAV